MAFVAPVLGDERPCSHSSCRGVMRFGRASDNCVGRDEEGVVKVLATATCPNPRGWICSADAGHFRPTDSRLLSLVKH